MIFVLTHARIEVSSLTSPFLSSICFSALNPRPHILLSNNCLPIYNWGNRFVCSSFPSQSRGFIRQTTFPKPELSSVWAGDGLGLHDDKLLHGKTGQKEVSWQREGSTMPPIHKGRSNHAMKKGTLASFYASLLLTRLCANSSVREATYYSFKASEIDLTNFDEPWSQQLSRW